MSDLESSIWKKYKDKGVLVYGLYQSELPELLEAFVEQAGLTFPVMPGNGTLQKFAFPPGTGYPYPRDVVVGKDGKIKAIKGSFNVDEMTSLIDTLLQ